jgi:hypothetical protein
MTEIRTKDKLFLAVVIPAALVAAYWYGWRTSSGRQIAELESRQEKLVAEEDFHMEMRRAERELAEAKAELEAERKIPQPQVSVKADPKASQAERERQALAIFREAGLTVVGSAEPRAIQASDTRAMRAEALLKATGARPCPIRRAYTIDGRYPDVLKALRKFDTGEMAVIPDRVQMRAEGRNRWTVEVWL